ncbi:hypothetical protein [Lactococcus cremoris]|uniref:hypothetical protein n=1 Tax=Lactococcus lactis subsp. cremoris TaxID=1359 RepID=UPI002FC5A459
MTYNSTLPKVFVYLLTTIETLYQTSVPLEVQNRKNVHLATSDCLVIACYLWGVLHFSETLKAKHQLAQSLFPNFLEYSRFVRRCNALLPSIQVIRQAIVFKEVEGFQLKLEMILLAYSLLLKSAKSLEPETLRYSIGYQVMAKY